MIAQFVVMCVRICTLCTHTGTHVQDKNFKNTILWVHIQNGNCVNPSCAYVCGVHMYVCMYGVLEFVGFCFLESS